MANGPATWLRCRGSPDPPSKERLRQGITCKPWISLRFPWAYLQVGDEVAFSLSYGALLAAMDSEYVDKRYRGDA